MKFKRTIGLIFSSFYYIIFAVILSNCVQARIDQDVSYLKKIFEQLRDLNKIINYLPHYNTFPDSEVYDENMNIYKKHNEMISLYNSLVSGMNNSGIINEYNYLRGRKIRWYSHFKFEYISDKLGNVITDYIDLLDEELLSEHWIKIKELELPVSPQRNINPISPLPEQITLKPFFGKEALEEFEIMNIIKNNDTNGLISFINKGFDINSKFKYSLSETPLSYAVANNSSPDIIEILLNAGADVNLKLSYPNVIRAVINDNKEILQILLNAGADVDEMDLFRRTALIVAIENGNMQIIEILLSYNANINHTQHHLSPLMKAIEKDNINIIKFLLQNGADVNLKVISGRTALQYAIDNEKSEIILLLKDAGAIE